MNGKISDFLRSKGVTPTGTMAPPAPPLPPAPPATGGTWQPGDPLNEDQTYFAAKGKSLKYVATMADNAPSAAIVDAWPDGEKPYTDAIAVRQAPPAPERGTINPPEAPAVAAATPQQAAELQGVAIPPAPVPAAPSGERDALKREAMALGLVDGSSRLGAESLAKLIAEHKAQANFAPVIPPGPAEQAQVYRIDPAPALIDVKGVAMYRSGTGDPSDGLPDVDRAVAEAIGVIDAAEVIHALTVIARFFRGC